MKRSGFKQRQPMARSPFGRVPVVISTAKLAKPKKKRSGYGMLGKPATAEQERWHGMVASVGCIACLRTGQENPVVSVHHIDGRTKPHAHWYVLPLCAYHHQQDDRSGVPAVHPNTARFEKEYGTQTVLFMLVCNLLKRQGNEIPVGALQIGMVMAARLTRQSPIK